MAPLVANNVVRWVTRQCCLDIKRERRSSMKREVSFVDNKKGELSLTELQMPDVIFLELNSRCGERT